MVVRGPTRALDPGVRHEVKVVEDVVRGGVKETSDTYVPDDQGCGLAIEKRAVRVGEGEAW